MSLILYFHPLASFCHKALIALYEKGIQFEGDIVDLSSAEQRARFAAASPLLKFPVLRDTARDLVIPESSIIIEHLDSVVAEPRMIPTSSDDARECRLLDRIFDSYVQDPMQRVIADDRRPDGEHDPHGVAANETLLENTYDLLEQRLRGRTWAIGDDFSMADCSAAPALFYARYVRPFGPKRPVLSAYYERLATRPSFVRVVEELQPYWKFFPRNERVIS
ncbi:MAG: glutathione S-transferase family protein [Polyangiaceae bacterium]|nr:glutathione S-transferase family protein [Polyangiaceae bacterium]